MGCFVSSPPDRKSYSVAYRSNTAEARYNETTPAEPSSQPAVKSIPLNLLPPSELSRPLWRSLIGNLRDTFVPEKLPPLQLTSRPVNVGPLLGDRLSVSWFRTVFTNIGDVLSPETLPPLELESRPVDTGELITDQLSHYWWTSLLRNLADRLAPESLPSLELTAKPISDIIPKSWILLPMWSESIQGPKIFYPDKPRPAGVPSEVLRPLAASSAPAVPPPPRLSADPTAPELLRDIRRSTLRQRIWIGLATVQVLYLVVATFWPNLF
jgi:hypothetical protein